MRTLEKQGGNEMKSHYKLRKDLSIEVFGRKLFRIEATKNIECQGVKRGEVGGYIETKENLSGKAWVSGKAQVYGEAQVSGKAQVSGEARVSGKAQVYGEAQVSGKAQVSGEARVSGKAQVSGEARVSGEAQVYGEAQVSGKAQVSGEARVSGKAQVSGDEIKTSKDIYNITSNAQYNITLLPNYIQIGCEFYKKEEWFKFTDKQILAMDGKTALRWWKQWKPILKAICKLT